MRIEPSTSLCGDAHRDESRFQSRPLKGGSADVSARRYRSVSKRIGIKARDSAFWDCNLSTLEWLLLLVGCMLGIALHLAPVLHSGLGVPMIYATAAISYFSPVSGFFYIACGQFLPFPEGSSHNPAQAGVLVWLPVILLRYHTINLSGLWRFWPVLPWLLYVMLLTGDKIYLPDSEYMKAVMYCVIACQLTNEAKGQFLKCLLGLSLGALLVMAAYWGIQFGLPIEISDWGGDREGFQRMGSVRADSVMVWPALLMGISGLLGIQIALASRESALTSPRWLTYGTLILCAAALPPLVSTMSHGAYAGFAMVAVALAWAMWMAGQSGAFTNPRFKRLMTGLCACIFIVGVLFAADVFRLRSKVAALEEHYKNTALETGVAASRSGVWDDSINTIMKYPLTGIAITGDKEVITSEYAIQGWYLSHNVFLDYGRATGIPGMLLLANFFFCPVYLMWRSGRLVRYVPFLLAHFAMFLFWMSLSFPFYKTFWALWMLMAMAIGKPHHLRPAARRPRRATRTIGIDPDSSVAQETSVS
jgi:O-antigen ligase